MSNKDDGGSAFLVVDNSRMLFSSGMSLRDYLAAKAMQGIMADTATLSQLLGIGK